MIKHVQGEKIHLTVKISRNNNKLVSKRAEGLNCNEKASRSDGESFKGDGRGVWE